ncbi:hypothetical protein [Eudoraea sp.]|uniref:hypothetical protein n=1 Tax=Eudoraea sp. TaxID=1979955 RepID=UPI003C72804A
MKNILSILREKWAEYVIEIIVIILGILGAFALTNWNEERLEKLEEIKVLKSVKADLEGTIKEFEFLNTVRLKVLKGTQEIFNVTNNNLVAYPEHTLDSLIALTFYSPSFNSQQGSIGLLFSSGKINLISNNLIQKELLAWPGAIEDMIEEEGYANKLLQGPYYKILAEYLAIQNVMGSLVTASLISKSVPKQGMKNNSLKSNYSDLFANRAFFNHLSLRATHMQTSIIESESLIEQAKQLIDVINKELGL